MCNERLHDEQGEWDGAAQHIERELTIEATPEVVYRVISTPEHLREWWPDEAELESVPGGTGTVSFGDRASRTPRSFR